jgi:hypothetical protein
MGSELEFKKKNVDLKCSRLLVLVDFWKLTLTNNEWFNLWNINNKTSIRQDVKKITLENMVGAAYCENFRPWVKLLI